MLTQTQTTLTETSNDRYRLVRERSYTSSHSDLVNVIMQLRYEKVTGVMTIDFAHGGINRVRFREEQDIRYEQK